MPSPPRPAGGTAELELSPGGVRCAGQPASHQGATFMEHDDCCAGVMRQRGGPGGKYSAMPGGGWGHSVRGRDCCSQCHLVELVPKAQWAGKCLFIA